MHACTHARTAHLFLTCDELKQAIGEACLSNLGAEVVPMPWLQGELESMTVQFIDPEGEVCTLSDRVDFDSLRSSKTLRVTQSGDANMAE